MAGARRRHHLRSRLSLSERRLDLSPHRRRALRARLSARAPDGEGNRSQYMERCAADLDHHGAEQSWNLARTTASALFLRGFDEEILEEMKGIADGASDAGATLGRPPHRPDRHGGRQHHRRARRTQPSAADHAHRPRRPAPAIRPYTSIASATSPSSNAAALSPPPAKPRATGAWSSDTSPGGRSRSPSRPT